MRTANGTFDTPSQRGLHYKLRSREYGKPMAMNSENMSDKLRRRLNSQFNDVIRFTKDLKSGVQAKSWTHIETAVTDLVNVLVDHLEKRDIPVASKHQMRHLFIAYGGLDALLQVLLPPITPSDARTISKASFREKSESWNEILLLIRELIITIPSLPDRYFSIEHISFMFTLLHHSSVFDSAVSALEEILAFREDPFPLYAVPKFFDLVKKFSSRHMAHFTRLISLTIFEPEDRQILEGTQVLRSLDLLRIRRSRTFRSSNFIVEKNQNLLVQMPDFIPRLVQVLRVVNHGPDLSEFIQRNIIAHLPISNDVMTFSSTTAGVDDWEHFQRLEKAIKDDEDQAATRHARSQVDASTASTARPATPQPTIMRELLEAVTPSTPSGNLELGNVIRVMLLAERHEIAQISPLGQAFLFSQQVPESEHEPLLELQQRLLRARLRRGYPSSTGPITAERGRNELLFHALILAPHMIEIIFVLCTLLSGRRKVFVQNTLLHLGMDSVLSRLFERMSWDAPPFTGTNTMEHIHGPNCECNPENAVRVQVLRLIHNYYDRDFMGNANKFALLSPGERQFFLHHPEALADVGEGLRDGEALHGVEKGLLSQIIDVLMKEPTTSQYRFWLSACVENFLRGCGRRGQIFVTERGALRATIHNVFEVTATGAEDTSPSIHSGVNAYQTSFDLVGEIIKCNPRVLEHLEASLSDEEFRGWIRVCLDHLVDSNVFLRSLYLTVELYHMANTHPLGIQAFEVFGYVENALTPAPVPVPSNRLCLGYLKASWSQAVPVVSDLAIEQYLDKKEALKQRKAKAVRSSTTGKRTAVSTRLTASRTSSTTSATTSSGLSSSPAQQFLQHIVNNATASLGGLMSTLTGSSASTPNRATATSSSSSSSSSRASSASASAAAVGKPRAIWDDSEIPILDDRGASPAKPDSSFGDGPGLHDGAFYTPPEGPQFARHADAATLNANEAPHVSVSDLAVSVSMLAASSDATKPEAAVSLPSTEAPVAARGGGGGGEGGIVPTTAAAPLTVQPKIFRFTMFLAQERLSILLRLMSNVSLYTINHENICCLNTALVMLLFDLQRLQLGQVLQKVRDMAEDLEPVIPALIASRKASHRQKSGGLTPMLCVHLLSDSADGSSVGGGSACGCAVPGCVGESQPNSPFGGGFSTKSNNSTASTGSSGGQKKKKEVPEDPVYKKNLRRRAEDQAISAYRNALAASHDGHRYADGHVPEDEDEEEEERPWSNGELVMMNFRELLWYWREYYLRRGRDRLSIEFSAHIAFHHFLNLVDLLCADDGSECALLPRPITLPESPYQMSNLQCLLSSRSLTRGDIIHL